VPGPERVSVENILQTYSQRNYSSKIPRFVTQSPAKRLELLKDVAASSQEDLNTQGARRNG
jgi:hypothetical protein